MRHLLLFFLISIGVISEGLAQPEIYIFRHGEKLEPWNTTQYDSFQPLSENGRRTSEKIASLFADKSVTAIFSSKTTRTLSTAWPLSQSKNLTIEYHAACADTSQIRSFMAEVVKKYKENEIIVIISHSNIIPYFLIYSGIEADRFKDFGITYSDQYHSYLTNTYNSYWIIKPADSLNKAITVSRFNFTE